MSKEQILNYIDVYDATPAEKRKSKIAEIADGLGENPWDVAETLKAAGCSVNLQWFNQLKLKAMKAGGDPDERAAEAAAAATPADASYLRKIIARQDRQLKEDAERYKALEDRAKELANQLHEKDGALAQADAKIRSLNADLFRLQEEKEQLEIYVNEADNDNIKLHEILDQYEAEAGKPAERHFFEIEGGEEPEADGGSEYPKITVPGGELDLADVINDFCGGLHGVEAYLCGRILEALWCWRLGNGADAMRVLQGLIQELLEMRLEEVEVQA